MSKIEFSSDELTLLRSIALENDVIFEGPALTRLRKVGFIEDATGISCVTENGKIYLSDLYDDR